MKVNERNYERVVDLLEDLSVEIMHVKTVWKF